MNPKRRAALHQRAMELVDFASASDSELCGCGRTRGEHDIAPDFTQPCEESGCKDFNAGNGPQKKPKDPARLPDKDFMNNNTTPQDLADQQTIERDLTDQQTIERRIARAVIEDALKADYFVTVDDGGAIALSKSKDLEAILSAMFTTDEDSVAFHSKNHGYMGFVLFNYGNGTEVITDCSDDGRIAEILARAEMIAEELEAEASR